MAAHDLTVYVAAVGVELVGTATALVMPNVTYACAPTVFVEGVVVAPRYRRQGVARAILQRGPDRRGRGRLQQGAAAVAQATRE
ncbi:MAG: GNAT family N-acetyltransferase [Nocardioidaceae bacterium]